MLAFAKETRLVETTFVQSSDVADYRNRIWTPAEELPFAGHPTIGSCRAWLDQGGRPRRSGVVVQECGIGLVTIRSDGPRLQFAAPPLIRSGAVDPALVADIERAIGAEVVDAAWADNGPGWIAVELASDEVVRSIRPDFGALPDIKLGVVGRAVGVADEYDVEVRAFFPGTNGHDEDPVTGSLNASIAVWLMGRDPSLRSYVARQGSFLGREGRVWLTRDDDGAIWVGGDTVTPIAGTVDI